jgi:hypothetical protein
LVPHFHPSSDIITSSYLPLLDYRNYLSHINKRNTHIVAASAMASSLDPTSLFDVKGLVAVITGGGSGL